ncbi:hypothetical protein GKZ28_01385 [Clostridium chromiireducens]|uniref:Uncharacterized protein n=1 Tax=Clostridium chromiireducens TaxID=225345 RepID=A0A964RIK3_9CLOT|nr:hypothetical protein [Clostridium chromiireducens]MVX62353.1 hypothetical protein [Clostridium chromiireducens]
MNDLMKLSENIQSSIFHYRIDDFNKQLIELINLLEQELANGIKIENQDKISTIKKIIGSINIAFENKDYLLFADILKYELEANFKVD